MATAAFRKARLWVLGVTGTGDERIVVHRFLSGISGEIKVMARHAPLLEGETYLLATSNGDVRVEIVGTTRRSQETPWIEHLFRVV